MSETQSSKIFSQREKKLTFSTFTTDVTSFPATLPLKVFVIVNGRIVPQQQKPIFPTGFQILYIIYPEICFVFIFAESWSGRSIFDASVFGVIEKASFIHTFGFISKPGVRHKIFTIQSYRTTPQKVDRTRDRCILYVSRSIKYIFTERDFETSHHTVPDKVKCVVNFLWNFCWIVFFNMHSRNNWILPIQDFQLSAINKLCIK